MAKIKLAKEKGKSMSQKIYVGIDLAKDSSIVAAINEEGNKAFSTFSISNNKEGMEKLLLKLS
ncbi:MAG: IS110 family transposase [Actinobacteria bacterium]|nr:IS110 family transposase [Actinomycetota bacterium]